MRGSNGIGVAAPDDNESLYELRVLSFDMIVLLATLKILLLPLKRRKAENAEFIVPIED